MLRAAHAGLPDAGVILDEVRDLVVETPHVPPLRARLYRPQGARSPSPALGFFHGGGFFSCDIDTHDHMCRWLASVSGCVVVSFDYRLAPEHRFPAQLDDAYAAGAWMVEMARTLGLDADRIALGGDSAGAYLAAATAARMNREQEGAIKLQLLIYPLLHIDEMACASEAAAVFRVAGRAAATFVQRQVLEPGGAAETLSADAIAHAPASIIVSGGRDPLRAEAAAFAIALRAAGHRVDELFYRRMPHGALNFPAISKAAQIILTEVAGALGAALTTSAPGAPEGNRRTRHGDDDLRSGAEER
jgi:acetyl esterase/lipase